MSASSSLRGRIGSCWECVEPPSAAGAGSGDTTTFLVAMRFHAQYRPANALAQSLVQHSITRYGHVYEHVERLFSCAEHFVRWRNNSSAVTPQLRLLLPSTYDGRYSVFAELVALLNGPTMAVERVGAIDANATVCGAGAGMCCVSDDAAGTRLRTLLQRDGSAANQHVRIAQLSVGFHAASSGRTKQRLRATVWHNQGLSESAVDTLLVSAPRLRMFVAKRPTHSLTHTAPAPLPPLLLPTPTSPD